MSLLSATALLITLESKQTFYNRRIPEYRQYCKQRVLKLINIYMYVCIITLPIS